MLSPDSSCSWVPYAKTWKYLRLAVRYIYEDSGDGGATIQQTAEMFDRSCGQHQWATAEPVDA